MTNRPVRLNAVKPPNFYKEECLETDGCQCCASIASDTSVDESSTTSQFVCSSSSGTTGSALVPNPYAWSSSSKYLSTKDSKSTKTSSTGSFSTAGASYCKYTTKHDTSQIRQYKRIIAKTPFITPNNLPTLDTRQRVLDYLMTKCDFTWPLVDTPNCK